MAMAPVADDPPAAGPVPATVNELKESFTPVVCENQGRLQAVRELFIRMGAQPSEIVIDRVRKVDNLTVRLQGTDPALAGEKVVVGAHYDKTDKGCGAVDNWTGVLTIASIYKAFKQHPPRRTMVFVAFGEEEKGLLGSKEMVDNIGKEDRKSYCAMVNIDSLGLSSPVVAENLSSLKLVSFAQRLAKEKKLSFGRAPLEGGNSDSTSFHRKNIPALTIHGLGNRWKYVLHTSDDTQDRVKFDKMHEGYRLAMELLAGIDKADCSAFR
ncbi:MAG: M28 family metallopeptidase [Blastocatellales bacterium]